MAERNPLSRQRIIDAAARLLEQDGWDALSMRRLAQELDVWPMAVYRYFRDKDELVDALVEHAAGGMETPRPKGDWDERLRALLDSSRVTLKRLPPELRARMGGLTAAAPDGIEMLESAGFDTEEARKAWSVLAAYTLGAVEIGDDAFAYGLDCLVDGLEAASAISVRR